MKASSATSVSIIVVLVALFYCPEHARSRGSTDGGTKSGGGGTETPEATARGSHLPVVPRMQEGYRTCWAACAEMIMEFLGGGRIRQCEQASVAFEQFNCCFGEGILQPAGPCDLQHFPEFEKWGFDFDYRDFRFNPPLTWEELKHEIDEGRPFAFSFSTVANPTINHMVVLIGYDATGGERTVTYLDPLKDDEPEGIIAMFSDYDGSSGEYLHRSDCFNIRPKMFP